MTPAKVLHEACTDGPQLLLLAAMVVGVVTGAAGQAAMKPFAADLFKGIPEANPSLYFGMSLGLTFPFNILVGIPLYVSLAHELLH